LTNVRAHCHQKIERAIYELYNYASFKECNLPFIDNPRTTTLQENMENAALETEKQERVIIQNL
jgi:hypothetical protein